MIEEAERAVREIELLLKEFLKDKNFSNEEEAKAAIADLLKGYDEKMLKKNQRDAEDSKTHESLESWDYLDMALEADTKEEALEYAKKALKLDKDFLDADVLIADLSALDREDLKVRFEALIKKAEKTLRERGFLTDDIGNLWGITETRPYVRLRGAYVKLLIELGKYKKAMSECEELIVLSENDNMGMRYSLMALYAFFENKNKALKLLKKYEEDCVMMNLPLMALYYKLDDYKKAKKYLDRIASGNDTLNQFLDMFMNSDFDEKFEDIVNKGMYQLDSIEEIVMAFDEGSFLYSSTDGLMDWMVQQT